MDILIIGGTGRISLMTSRFLSEKGNNVFVLNRGNNNSELSNVETIICDVNNGPKMTDFLDTHRISCVLQFVAFDPSDIQRDYQYFKGRSIHYIFISTCVTYDRFGLTSFIDENHKQSNPLSPYGQKKIEAENELRKIGLIDPSFHWTILRPSHTFDYRAVPTCIHGKNGTYSILHRILNNKPIVVADDGTNIWPMLYARDFGKGVEGLLCNPAAYGEAFNITAEERHSWNEIYDLIGEIAGKKAKKVYIPAETLAHEREDLRASLCGDKALNCLISNEKLIRLVPEFRNQTPLKAALKTAYDYVMSHPEAQKLDPDFDQFEDYLMEKYGK